MIKRALSFFYFFIFLCFWLPFWCAWRALSYIFDTQPGQLTQRAFSVNYYLSAMSESKFSYVLFLILY